MKPAKLIMFDYDGVIVDSLQVFCRTYIAACQQNGLQEIKTEKDVLALFEHNVYAALLQRGVTAQTIDKILKDYERRQSAYLTELKLFDSIGDVLREIAKNNRVFIITSNVSSAAESVMQRYGIDCLEEVIGAEKEKSKIRKIEMVMARFPELPAFYVGDTQGDMIEGKAAGATAVGAAWGWHGMEKLKAGGADVIVRTPLELVSLFSN